MGEVFHATDLDLNVTIALKTIRPEIASDPASVRRLKQEVLLARSVSHPNVCRIYDLGRDHERSISFLTMEYLAGETLARRIARHGAISHHNSLPLIYQLAGALDAAHAAGIVHRDFKSANVMLVPTETGERAVVTDFGLAIPIGRSTEEETAPDTHLGTSSTSHLDSTGVDTEPLFLSSASPREGTLFEVRGLVGTLAYMSPEQVSGGSIGPRSDLYAFGIVLYEMTTGELPFHGSSPGEIARARLQAPPAKPSTIASIEPGWDQAILKLMQRAPEERYACATDAVRALEGQFHDRVVVDHFLIAERDAFVGRETELETLSTLLPIEGHKAKSQLLTLLGTGGTGKSRLALNYGWKTLDRWPGGVWFCDLSDVRTESGIAAAVASTLNVPLDEKEPIELLGHAIAGRGPSLIILDNFEQVAEHAASTVGFWLTRCTQTSFLVTSRERLRLPSEKVLTVAPLDPETLGVELFELRAQTHRSGFRVDESNRALIGELVARLDGLPLAIELAAARLQMMSLNQLHDRLESRFEVLGGGRSGRQSTLRSTLDWSWELLEPWEQAAVSQASVFEGGFSLEAAEAVLVLGDLPGVPPILDVIQALLDKSWLRTRVALDAPRFSFYRTVQKYASEHLRATSVSSETEGDGVRIEDVEARHSMFFSEMGTVEAIDLCHGKGSAERHNRLRLETENLMAACRWAAKCQTSTIAVSALAASWEALRQNSHGSVALELGHRILDIPGMDALDRARSCSIVGEILLGVSDGDPAKDLFLESLSIYRSLGETHAVGVVLNHLGLLFRLRGQLDDSREVLEESVSLLQSSGDRVTEGSALGKLGHVHHQQGRIEEASEFFERSLSLHRAEGDKQGEGILLIDLGEFQRDQGRVDEALQHYNTALEIQRELGDRRSEALALGKLSTVHQYQGRLEEARRGYETALHIHRELGDRRSEALWLTNLGGVSHRCGQTEDARVHYEAALPILREVGDRSLEGITLGNLGNLYNDQGSFDQALVHLEQALKISQETGERRIEGLWLLNLGSLRLASDRLELAQFNLEQSLSILEEFGDKLNQGIAHGNIGNIARGQGRADAAEFHLQKALALSREVGDRGMEGTWLGFLGSLRTELGETGRARAEFEEALEAHREVGNRRSEGITLGQMGDLFLALEQVDEARNVFSQAISILQESDSLLEVAKLSGKLAELELGVENLEAARHALARSQELSARLDVAPESDLAKQIAKTSRLLDD